MMCIPASLEEASSVTSQSSLRALRAVFRTLAPGSGWEQETHQAARIREQLAKSLPGPLAAACEAWLEQDGQLVIACPNGAVAAKIKQLSPRILHCFGAELAQVSSIRVEVQAARLGTAGPSRARTRVPPPDSAASEMEAAAAALRAPALAAAMLRLAAHLRERGLSAIDDSASGRDAK
jgi:hypothetical protein